MKIGVMVLALWLDKLLWHKWPKSRFQALDTRANIFFNLMILLDSTYDSG